MIKSFCKKEDFQPITDLGNKSLIKFSKEAIMTPVLDEEGKPTGEMVDSGLVSYVEEYIFGDVTPEAVLNVRLAEIKQYGEQETAEYHANALRQLTTVDELLAYDIHAEIPQA